MWTTDKNWFDDLLIKLLERKTLGFLGVDNCGKSVLCNFLLTGELKHGVLPSTSGRDRTKIVQIKIEHEGKNKTIKFNQVFDVGGHRDIYDIKKTTFTTSDCIIYIVRSDLIIDINELINIDNNLSNYISYFQSTQFKNAKIPYKNGLIVDFENFKYWAEDMSLFQERKPSQIIIVGNHFGIKDDQKRINENSVTNFLDLQIQNEYLRVFKESFNKITGHNQQEKKIDWVVGSLASREFAQQLVIEILKRL